jgi:hypothetical protein
MEIHSNKIMNKSLDVKRFFRSPTLDTVRMVETSIEKNNGEFKRRQIWERLPRKVMWSTFIQILSYLEEINKIMITKEGIVLYVWNPELSARYMKRQGIKYVKTKRVSKKKRKRT